jgi:uncharacterized protein YfaS (alpha-2-macroglobulin family)
VEQTASGVMALAGLRGLIREGWVPGLEAEETDKYLERGVARLLQLQTDSGGLSYWPGYGKANPWGTAYGAVALALARQAGFSVPEPAIKRISGYLSKRAEDEQEDRRMRAFAVFALAVTGDLDRRTLSSASWGYSDDDRLSTLFLALASGSPKEDTPDFLAESVRRVLDTDWRKTIEEGRFTFNARYLEPSLALLAGTVMMPEDPLTVRAARFLLDGLGRNGRWTSTSDTGWALVALGEYYRKTLRSVPELKVTAQTGEEELGSASMKPGAFHVFRPQPGAVLENRAFELKTDADLPLYYRMEVSFPRLDYAQEGHQGGFRLWKKIENTDGSGVIRLGDVVKVTVGLEFDGYRGRYAVLDDPLPAGLVAVLSQGGGEVDPSVTGENRVADALQSHYWTPEGFRFPVTYREAREQRVIAFADSLWEGTYRFEYYARAICEGVFKVPSTKAELMYEPEVNGFTPASTLEIEPRK